jgi:hypothetical protein
MKKTKTMDLRTLAKSTKGDLSVTKTLVKTDRSIMYPSVYKL